MPRRDLGRHRYRDGPQGPRAGRVTEWQYGVVRDQLADRADLVVWLDLPRRSVMRQVVTRTVRRRFRREVLWNGNIEPPLHRILFRSRPYCSLGVDHAPQDLYANRRTVRTPASPRYRSTSLAGRDRQMGGFLAAWLVSTSMTEWSGCPPSTTAQRWLGGSRRIVQRYPPIDES